jgi:hypothetical protein
MHRHLLLVCSSVFFVLASSVVSSAQEAQPRDLEGRVEIEHRSDNFKATVFLRNPTEKDISFASGRGGVAKTLVPSFTCGAMSVSPAKFRSWPRRAMRPIAFTVPAGKEVVYDDYILAYPEIDAGIYPLELRFSFGTKSDQKLSIAGELEIPKKDKAGDGGKK